MPPKRTPEPKRPKEKTPKSKGKPRIIKPPVIRSRDSSVDSVDHDDAGTSETTSATTNPIIPPIVGMSPDFMAYIQLQERIRAEEKLTMEKLRAEEKAVAERQRKEDLERADFDKHAQQKAHEVQIQMLQEQLMAMAARNESSGPKSSSKMPMFDLVKDKDTFKLWKSRWDLHVQGHKFDSISNSVERNVRLRAELNSCLSDDTLNWLLNNNFSKEDLAKADFVLQAIELKVNESTNPLIQQIEMSKIAQFETETGDHLVQRIRELAGKCSFEKITNVQDHYSMLTLLKAVKPSIRKKMLLQKVDSFEKAINVLLSEEQANSDTRQCSGTEAQNAEVFAMSSYRRDQQSQRASTSTTSNTPKSDYTCYSNVTSKVLLN